ncbi:MAG: Lrp/AsnC family transcriptional regulator [Alphaproteobacteria bacterium]|jgi:Lrp/AsnC family transcriptional regulator, regulator of ectoine-degradation genes|nr:Lrp/AsnC family transcriptional regulator [Alphaproteobacteria bacterium]MBU0805113.1 Lrp/AsnC family transcriptional regulator [Alphaproteobacteria bacterium]MBU0870612.1 Lrp/AsnC family transcriptional regulator [Alphaproteobacteria bacterium]MBU1401713.1 Lrp/AsnC family transcriptional regulator [Alphaproteobacteria bacterium]MBU1591870.1 Lrp/AsnC family transcriptional regulator [Alphaproteobacteria bacterium]
MAGIKLDPTDLRILDAVQRDGRITKLRLAEEVGLSPTPCWVRLRRLEKAGVVSGYHASIDMRTVAPVAVVLMEVTLRSHRQADFDRFERAVRDCEEIITCWSVGGGVDYLLKVMARDIDAYQRLVDGLLEREIGIDRYFTYIVTKTVKDEAAVPIANLLPASTS